MPTGYGSAIYARHRPGGRRRLRRAGARRRRDRTRQNRHDRIRLLHAGQDRQPAQPGAYPRRLVERLGRRGGRQDGAARLRYADRRLGDPAGRVLRHRRLQAELRHDPARRRQDAVRQPRHGRDDGAQRRRRGVLRRSRRGTAGIARPRAARSAAAFRPLPHADVGRGRARDGGGARPRTRRSRTRRRPRRGDRGAGTSTGA